MLVSTNRCIARRDVIQLSAIFIRLQRNSQAVMCGTRASGGPAA
jgi:hypothetical protein